MQPSADTAPSRFTHFGLLYTTVLAWQFIETLKLFDKSSKNSLMIFIIRATITATIRATIRATPNNSAIDDPA